MDKNLTALIDELPTGELIALLNTIDAAINNRKEERRAELLFNIKVAISAYQDEFPDDSASFSDKYAIQFIRLSDIDLSEFNI